MNMVLGQSFLMFVLSVFLEATHLYSNYTMHWSKAVQFCSEQGLVLKKSELSLTEKRTENFWTRMYIKESDFISVYGCMNDHYVNKSEHIKMDQSIQECLNKRHLLFIMQNSSCFCLSNPQPKLQQQCNLATSSFVFGVIETFKKRESCVLIDCHKNRTVHLVKCDENANVFCGDKVFGNFTWKSAAKKCIQTRTSFKPDPNQICSKDDTIDKMRYWFGFGTLNYTDEFLQNNGESDVNQTLCQSCKDVCKFEDCNMMRIAACESNVESVSVTIKIDRESGTTKVRPNQPTKDTMFRTTNLMHDQPTRYTKIKLDKTTKQKLTQTERDATKYGQVKTTKEMLKQTTMDFTKDDRESGTTKDRPNQPTKDTLFRTTNLMHDQTTNRESGTTKDRPNQPTKDTLFRTTNLMHDQTTRSTKIKLDKTTKQKLTQTERHATKDGQVKTTKEMLQQTTMDLTKGGENKTIEQSTKVASDTTTDVKEPYEMVAVYCLSILVLILSLLVVYCLCQRCRNQKKQILENNLGISNNTPAEDLALATGIYELADNSKLDIGDQNHTEENTVKEPGNIKGSIGELTKLTGRQTNEDVYNHLWEKAADSCPKTENIYDQCNLGGKDIYKYCVTRGPHASSATVNANYDRVTLVSANVDTSV